jgi:peroxiredoxin
MKPIMNLSSLLLIGALQFTACSEAPAGKESHAQEAAPVASFVNGITPENAGSRRGPVTLSGSVSHNQWKKLYLYSTYGRVNTRIDSADVANSTFAFRTQEVDAGIYMVGPADNNLCPVILNPAESTVQIRFGSTKADAGTTSISSKENEGWLGYFPRENGLLKQIRDLRASAKKSSMGGEFEKQAVQKENELLALQGELIAKYSGTHLAKLLTWKQEPDKTDKSKYWNNIDFSDESIVRSTVLTDRIQNFMRAFSRGEESGFIDCIAVVAEKAKANDIVLEFALNQMLTGFYESGMENISTYLIDNYIHGDACGDANFSSIIQGTAESIARLGVGKTPPNITGKTSDGKFIDLMKLAASKKYTLVMFWSSWCEHCKGEAPEVVTCYNLFKDNGFEIVGYSVDQAENAWRSAIQERGFEFPNLCGFQLWDSKGAKDYRITKTPGFFLLDQSGTIVLKPKGIREVQAFLKANLK